METTDAHRPSRGAPSSHDCDTRYANRGSLRPPVRRSWPPYVPWHPPSPHADGRSSWPETCRLTSSTTSDPLACSRRCCPVATAAAASASLRRCWVSPSWRRQTLRSPGQPASSAAPGSTSRIFRGRPSTPSTPRALSRSPERSIPAVWLSVRGTATASTAAGPSPAGAITLNGSSATAWRTTARAHRSAPCCSTRMRSRSRTPGPSPGSAAPAATTSRFAISWFRPSAPD